MAIYEIGYRALDYRQTSMAARIGSIVALEYKTLFRRKLGVVLFFLCMLPALFNLVVVLLWSGVLSFGGGPSDGWEKIGQVNPRMDPTAIEFFLVPVLGEPPAFLVFLVLTTLVGCRAIAKDRESNALELYMTRCIEPSGYLLGKWLGSFALLGTVFVAGPLLTWTVGVLISPDWTYFEQTRAFFPGALAGLAAFTALLTTVVILFSAAAASANAASALWLGVVLGTLALGNAVAGMLHGAWWCKVISPWDASKRVAEAIAGYVPTHDYPVGWAIGALAILLLPLAVVARRRLGRGEAIG